MRINITIKLQDEAEEVVTTIPADFIQWERTTKMKMSDLYVRQDGEMTFRIGLEDLACLAWAVKRRTGGTAESFNAWQLKIEDIPTFELGEQADPIQSAVSTDS
jgi:hypothetical protein